MRALRITEDLRRLHGLVGVGSVLLAALLVWAPVAESGERKELIERLARKEWQWHNAIWMAKKGATILHVVAQENDKDFALVIPNLVEGGEDPNARANNGYTPLHYAGGWGIPEIIDALVAVGGNVEAQDPIGRTPLHFAALGGNVPAIETLLTFLVDVNVRERSIRATPLHLAANRGHPSAIKTLLQWGADVNSKTSAGETPLHAAARGGNADVIRVLVKSGAKVNARAKGRKGMKGLTPLHLAAGSGHTDAVLALLNVGADPMARALETITPLEIAKMRKDKTEGDVRGHYEVIKILTQIEDGIRETLRPSRKPTPRKRKAKPPLRIHPL